MGEQNQQHRTGERQPPRGAVLMDYTAVVVMLLGAAITVGAAFAFDARLGLAVVGVGALAVGYLLAVRDGVSGG